jgi:hypothetical protein
VPKLFIVPSHDTTERVTMAKATPETPTGYRAVNAGFLDRISRSNTSLVMGWFVLILILKWPTLTQPPVWDASMSVFPAAITLAENNFDLGHLLEQPGYIDGGPNVHSISLITWLTAGVIAVAGPDPALFPVLHVIHFLIAALAFTGLFRLGELAFGSTLAGVTALTALTVPVVLTQVGSMYMEIALLAAGVHAVLAWQQDRLVTASALATVAVLIKGSGVFIAGALAVAALLDRRGWPTKLRSAAILMTPSLFVSFLMFDQATVESTFNYRIFRIETSWYLSHIPDVLLLLVGFAVASTLVFRHDARHPDFSPPGAEASRSVLISTSLFVLAFIGFFFVLLPLAGKFFSVLPRYYTVVVPFMLLGLAVIAHRIGARAIAFGGLAVLLVFSIVNRNGAFYPDNDFENFALVERSGAYRDLLALQQQGTDALVLAARDQPAFYTHSEHYRFSYPAMGYADQRPPVGHNLNTDQLFTVGRLEDFPDTFVMLHEWNWLGGEVVKQVWEQALADPRREVDERIISVGEYRSTLVQVSTRQAESE